jgi:hypothetical protein
MAVKGNLDTSIILCNNKWYKGLLSNIGSISRAISNIRESFRLSYYGEDTIDSQSDDAVSPSTGLIYTVSNPDPHNIVSVA